MLEFLFVIVMICGHLAFEISRIYNGSLEAVSIISMRNAKNTFNIMISLAAIARIAMFVLGFFIFDWWLAILLSVATVVFSAFLFVMPLRRNHELAMDAYFWICAITFVGAVSAFLVFFLN